MRKLIWLTAMLLAVAGMQAAPALRGVWKLLTLTDGTTVRAELQGDEHLRYWRSDDGRTFIAEGDAYVEATLTPTANRSRSLINKSRAARRAQASRRNTYTGQKRGLIILASFRNKQFNAWHDQAFYERVANEKNLSMKVGLTEQYRGSVRDYFLAQSGGQFDLSFDVVGPVQLSQSYEYYGKNIKYDDDQEEDEHAGEMIAEACRAVNEQVNFADYDWDGDGEVDQVMVIFAGRGENSGGGDDTVWPHEFMLEYSDYGRRLQLDGTYINTYACIGEMHSNTNSSGIGTICHEFSHCLGLPDYYDTNYKGNYGLGSWSVMSGGSYNGNSFCPAGYMSIDKWMCGWQEPISLENDTVITGMRPLSEGGDFYLLRNNGYDNEFYLLENRQKTGWDEKLPGHGLLVLHVDYDDYVWSYNEVNATDDSMTGNDHQRCTIFHADNTSSSYDEEGDPYPYIARDSLTRWSKPAATLYHTNADGSKYMDKAILDITQEQGGTMGFTIVKRHSSNEQQQSKGYLFYESFDKCNGTGGNDGKWSGNIASVILKADNEGWVTDKGRSANKCACFGTTAIKGLVTTPAFDIDGEATLTFRAAPWVGTSDGTELQLSIQYAAGSMIGHETPTISKSEVEMKRGQWTDYKVTLRGEGSVKVSFLPDQRFFLDEVKVTAVSAGISHVPAAPAAPSAIYTLDGRYAGTDESALKPGLYIRQGRKVLVK